MKIEKNTVSLRLSDEQKQFIETLGDGSLSRGVNELIAFHQKYHHSIMEQKVDPFIDQLSAMELEIEKIDKLFWREEKNREAEIELLKEQAKKLKEIEFQNRITKIRSMSVVHNHI
jgi:hypothetical protein